MSLQTPDYQSPTLAPSPAQRSRRFGGDILACGFGITAAVWIAAYICRLPFVEAPGEITVAVMMAVVLLGGFMAARYSSKGIICALAAGALSGLLDILLVGAIMHDYVKEQHDAVVPPALLWVGGSLALSTLIAAIGGIVGRFFPSRRRDEISWTHIFALILTTTTFLLIGAGGLVTAFKAGLAVPDWPRSYGYNMFLFPLSLMQQESGKYYEHAHRLIASLVGFTSLFLAILITLADRRGWVKALAWSVGFGVLIQAILGGTRVTQTNITLAMAHGVFAQMVFAAMAALATVTAPRFYTSAPSPHTDASLDRSLTLLLLFALACQLTLGAMLRHQDKMLIMHIVMATVVTLLVLVCGIRAGGCHASQPPILRSGLAILAVVLLQITLGIIALIFWTGNSKDAPPSSALSTTAHQLNGALLLALSTVLTVWTWRLLRPAISPVPLLSEPAQAPAVTY